jgi:hypothetical protein
LLPGNVSGNADLDAADHLLNAVGIGVSRYSPTTDVYDMVDKWKKKNGIEAEKGAYPPSKFRDLRNAIQDDDEKRALDAWKTLLAQPNPHGKPANAADLVKAFHQSTFHAFTGSTADDKKFKDGLSGHDKLTFEAAENDRKRIWDQFKDITKRWAEAQQKPAAPQPSRNTFSIRG